MKKTRSRKLVLSRETLKNLACSDLTEAVGGWTTLCTKSLCGCTATEDGCGYGLTETCN